jgi:hypothetical protein
MAKDKYLFIRMDEAGVVTQLTANLDDFKLFCHYSSLSDWSDHKKLIKKCLQKTCQYAFTGNDVWYYILLHPTWESIPSSELTITTKGDN